MKTHVVIAGECMATLAARYGFADVAAIYDHPDNAELKQQRPDPHLLFPGDVVHIPDREDRGETVPLGASHTFVVQVPKKQLKVAFHDAKGPRANLAFTLKVAGETITGTTDASGQIDEKIPAHARMARLQLGDATFELEVGGLDPIAHTPDDGHSGLRMRLGNLGFRPDDDSSRALGHAIAMFQLTHGLDVTGIADVGTIDALQKAHGS